MTNRNVEKLQPGQKYRYRARHHNAFADAANAPPPNGPPPGVGGWPSGDVISLRNDSGEDVKAFELLAIEGVGIDPTKAKANDTPHRWADSLIHKGVKPDLTKPGSAGKPHSRHIGHFAILLEPLKHQTTGRQKIGRAVISGLVTARLKVDYDDHPFADVADGSFVLTSNWYGSAEILYKHEIDPGDSHQWAIVRLSNFRTAELEVKVAEPYGIQAGGSGSAVVWWNELETNPKQTLQAHLKWMHGSFDSSLGSEARLRYDRDKQQWRFVAREC